MRKAMIAGMMVLAGFCGRKGQGAEVPGYQVTVYVQDQQVADPLLLARAKALTTSMFAGIGVRLRWEPGGRPARAGQTPPDAEIVARLASRTPAGFHAGAPAYSLPDAPPSGVRITIFYDRVLGPAVGDLNVGVAFLGHVLAHEIAHVLQGITRHSEEGVMKAQWTPQDRVQMREGALPFTAHDAELIRLAMLRHQLVVITNEAQVPPGVLAEAQQEVVRMFEHAGIKLRIQDCSAGPSSPGCDGLPQNTLFLLLLPTRPDKNVGKDALESTLTSTEGGDYASIFMPRVDDASELARPLATRAQILGHAMAHEVGHLLAGPDHRPSGLMRADWSRADYQERSRGLMLIAAPDAARMRAGVDRRAAATPLAAR